MNAHRIETRLNEDRTLTLRDLPFEAGTPVEVIVLETRARANGDASTRAPEEHEQSWAEEFAREVAAFWEQEGERTDVPHDWAANFDAYKRPLIQDE